MVIKWRHYTRFAGYGITRMIEVHDPMFDDDVNVHYLFVWLQECPQFRSHVVQRTRPDQEEPQDLLSPDWRGEGPGGLPRLDPLQTRQSAEVDWASGHLRPSRAVPVWPTRALER